MNRQNSLLVYGTATITFWLIPAVAKACEPIIPLLVVFSGPSLLPSFLLHSGIVLTGAVALKCGVFVFYERSLPITQGVLFMLAANIVSTIVGVLVGVSVANPVVLITLPMLYVMTVFPARRLQRVSGIPNWSKMSPRGLALLFIACLFASYFFFAAASSLAGSSKAYWLAKLAYLFPALFISIGLTTLWEESVVYLLARRRSSQTHFFEPVLKSNVVAFVVLMGLAAALALPKRLASSDFLLSW